jgi:hypothetical protein
MLTSSIAAASILIAALGPGAVILSWIDVEEEDRWAVCVAISLLFAFLVSFFLYFLHVPTTAAWGITAICVVFACFGRNMLFHMLTSPLAKMQAVGLLMIIVNALLLDVAIRNYNGLLWASDWYEHYQRALFFIVRPDPTTARFLEYLPHPYLLPARPPFMNVIVSHALSHGEPTYAAFQVVSTILSAFAYLPVAALAARLAAAVGLPKNGATITAAAMLILLPSFSQNVTFPWTKLLTAFYVLTALTMLARNSTVESLRRVALAGLFLGAGIAVHYSAVVFALPVALMAIWVRRRSPGALITGLTLLGSVAVVLAPWIVYSAAVFGAAATFGSNTAVVDAAGLGITGNLIKVVLNIRDTLIPHFLRPRPPFIEELMHQPNILARIRDWWFAPLQVNFPMAVGTMSQVVIAAGLPFALRSSPSLRRLAQPWLVSLGCAVVLGIAVHGARDTLGLAHICLQPVILLAAAAAGVLLPCLPVWLRYVAVAGLAWDYLVGVLLQVWLEMTPVEAVAIASPDGSSSFGNLWGIGGAATVNAYLKQSGGLVFLGDTISRPEWCLTSAALLGASSLVFVALWAWKIDLRRGNVLGACEATEGT